ncbi:MAG: hypothetical protein ACJA01_001818 [Saprospiraceae bacterium]|jgi:hypothetical protein
MRIITLLLILSHSFALFGQIPDSKINVFLDCQTNCFTNFLRQEIQYINYVRDRQDADIYILATFQNASAGAREIQLIYLYEGFESLGSDTIRYIREANISDLQEMNIFKNKFKRGLLPALVKSDLIDQISFNVNYEETQLDTATILDPWNFWSFNLSLNLNISGEKSFNEQGFYSRASASRITADNKTILSSWYNIDESTFTLSDGEEVDSENERFGLFVQWVESMGPHWGWGFRSFVGSSTFGNMDFEGSFKPAIEYNIYPYSESSTQRFSFLYSVGIIYNNYAQATVFDKLEESLLRHGLDVEYEVTQPWGDIEFNVEFDQFLKDISLFSLSLNPELELNLVKGLRLQFGGEISYIGDRINITKGDISAQDIILQNRQLDTSYSYYTYFGFNFRFGSKNNNVVNSRF